MSALAGCLARRVYAWGFAFREDHVYVSLLSRLSGNGRVFEIGRRMPGLCPLSEEAIYCQRSRTAHDKGCEASEVQEIAFVTDGPDVCEAASKKWRGAAARASDHRDDARPDRHVNVDMAENRQDGHDENPARHAKHPAQRAGTQ